MIKTKKRNKYNAVRVGKDDSKLEHDYHAVLMMKKAAGHFRNFTHQPPQVLMLDRSVSWKLDFRVEMAGGNLIYIEIKGKEVEPFQHKWKIYRYEFKHKKIVWPLILIKAGRGGHGFQVADHIGDVDEYYSD